MGSHALNHCVHQVSWWMSVFQQVGYATLQLKTGALRPSDAPAQPLGYNILEVLPFSEQEKLTDGTGISSDV